MITYFLALPLSMEEVLRLKKHSAIRQLFINQRPYLDLISYQGTFYLAKQIPQFPLSVEEWEKNIAHVSSVLRHTFEIQSIDALQLLPCVQGWKQELCVDL